MKSLSSIKLANSVKSGNKEETYFSDAKHEITVENTFVVRIRCKRSGDEVMTTLFNAISFKESRVTQPKEPEASTAPTTAKPKGPAFPVKKRDAGDQ